MEDINYELNLAMISNSRYVYPFTMIRYCFVSVNRKLFELSAARVLVFAEGCFVPQKVKQENNRKTGNNKREITPAVFLCVYS